jgi:hypothetical protein
MSMLGFLLRRLVSALVARHATNYASRHLDLSPGAANLLFVALTEVMARGSEIAVPEPVASRV